VSFESISRRGNLCDAAQAEKFMKSPKVKDADLMEYSTYEEVPTGLPIFLTLAKLAACIQP
jgi:hypothetical protein